MFKSTSLGITVIILSSIMSVRAETYCMWSINEPKGKMNEDGMKGQCDRKEVKGAKNYSEDYTAQGRKFRIEYLGQNNGPKQKVKINGKIGTATEENRYSKNMTTDDLTIDFTYDEVLPDKSLSLSKLQGVWVRDIKRGCKRDEGGNYMQDTVAFSGNKLERALSESQCSIYAVGKTTVGNFNMILANCDNEGEKDKEMFMYDLTSNGKELSINGMPTLSRCPPVAKH